jgi:23S rRNA U2552 (ribose-2'-O)-methylase RlmE/FtsJ
MSDKTSDDMIDLPVIFKLPSLKPPKTFVFDYAIDAFDDYPRFNLGFHHYIHTNKDKLEITKEFNEKKKVYLVMNKFEVMVDNYDNDISTIVSKKLKTPLQDLNFFKTWELLMTFDILNKKENKIAFFSKKSNSFVQAFNMFKSYYYNDNDKYFVLHDIDDKLKNLYVMKHDKKNDGNLRNPYTIDEFSKSFKIDSKIDIVVANETMEFKHLNTQEQEITPLILCEIHGAFKLLSNNGTLILTVYETFTNVMKNIISLLIMSFEHVYIYKPLTSRNSDSEKYLVCVNFKSEIGSKFMSMLNIIVNKLSEDNKNNLYKLNITDSKELTITLSKANNDISNNQLLAINDISNFIQGGDYHGDLYNTRNQSQMKANDYWIENFFPSKDSVNSKTKHIHATIKNIIERNDSRIKKMQELLI